MAPETRSRGAPPENRVYHSTPLLKQSQFPARRKIIRTYGKKKRQENVVLKQQTLTQIDFVSSFSEDPVQLSDSESEKSTDEREGQNLMSDLAGERLSSLLNGQDDDTDSLFLPRTSKQWLRLSSEGNKRKRAPTDDTDERPETTIPSSTAISRHHTQTLTQFLGRDPHLPASESSENDSRGFLDWLGESQNRNTENKRQKWLGGDAETSHQGTRSNTDDVAEDSRSFREESVILQTPIKPKDAHVGITSPGDTSTASTVHTEQDSLLNHRQSTLKKRGPTPDVVAISVALAGKPNKSIGNSTTLVIEDSYVTDSWTSETPTRRSQRCFHLKESQHVPPLIVNTTPHTSRLTVGSSEQLIIESPKLVLKGKRRVGFKDVKLAGLAGQKDCKRTAPVNSEEIPDSEDEDEDEYERLYEDGLEGQDTFVAGAETQLVLEELAFVEHQLHGKQDSVSKLSESKSSPSTLGSWDTPQATSKIASARAMENAELATTNKIILASQITEQKRNKNKPIRRLAHPPILNPSQLLESQRVPVHILQALPPASARSDIILPISSEVLNPILNGYEVNLYTCHKIPEQVVRFWLFDGSSLRHMACVEPGKPRGSDWAHLVEQIYELNNPVTGGDMQEEGWIDGHIKRYAYLPPAVVGQLLWNLRHAVFDNTGLPGHSDDKESTSSPKMKETGVHDKYQLPSFTPTVSQQILVQIQHDLVLSTRASVSDNEIPIIGSNASRPSADSLLDSLPRRPTIPTMSSQITAESLTSITEPQLHPEYSLSSSLTFQDHGGSAVIPSHDIQLDSSQLLTKSQMLPDSLVQDGPGLPQEIWDSDGDMEL